MSGVVVRTVSTDLGLFGNRTDIFSVEDGVVRAVSLLECTNPNVDYFHNLPADPEDLP